MSEYASEFYVACFKFVEKVQCVYRLQHMKNYAKVGNRKGKPAYRTPSSFRYRNIVRVQNRAKRLERPQPKS